MGYLWAKQREDEIQGLELRLRFHEAAVKRLEGVDKVREVEGNPDFSNKDVGWTQQPPMVAEVSWRADMDIRLWKTFEGIFFIFLVSS